MRSGSQAAVVRANRRWFRGSNAAIVILMTTWDDQIPEFSAESALKAVCNVLESMGGCKRVDAGKHWPPRPARYFARHLTNFPTLEELRTDAEDEYDKESSRLAAYALDGAVSERDLVKASRILALYLNAWLERKPRGLSGRCLVSVVHEGDVDVSRIDPGPRLPGVVALSSLSHDRSAAHTSIWATPQC